MPISRRPAPSQPVADPRRAVMLVALRGGVTAASGPLVVLVLLGVIGWFLTDGGIHGTAGDGVRAGALAWLLGHGSGVQVRGATVTVLPIVLTAFSAYAAWRAGHRTGAELAAQAPEPERISGGERDLTLPSGVAVFAAAYVVVAVLVAVVAGTGDTSPSIPRVLLWSLLIAAGVGGLALAAGSGRLVAAAELLPADVRVALRGARWLLGAWLVTALLVFVVALLVDAGAAMSVFSRLHTGTGGGILLAAVCLLAVPNAVVFAGSWLLGPGFAVGTGTVASPSAVDLGPVPMFPLLAALPDDGPTPAWAPFVVVVPVLLAALAVVRAHRDEPTYDWAAGMLRGLGAGLLAGAAFGVLASVAGGAVGPGRMADVTPFAGQVLLQGLVQFGIGGLVGGLAATWWSRRGGDDADLAAAGEDTAPIERPATVDGTGDGAGDGTVDAAAGPTIGLSRLGLGRIRRRGPQ